MSERFVLSLDGCDLAGERWAGDAGTTVVLLHEGVADRRGWHRVAELLSPQVTVVAYDRRGYGESPVSTGEFTHAGDLRTVMDREGAGRAWLVGASAGPTWNSPARLRTSSATRSPDGAPSGA